MQTDVREEKLQAVAKSGKPIADRVATIEAARDIYKKLDDAASTDAFRRQRIKGQIDGKPPFDPDRMAELGLGYVTNTNFLELRAVLDDRASRRFSSYYEVPTLIRVRANLKFDPTKAEVNYSNIIEEEFTRLLKEDWNGFYPLLDLVGRESDSYGVGVALFPDEWDWRPKAHHTSKFLPEPNAKLDIDELPLFALKDSFTAGDLFRAIDDEALAAKSGWNVPFVRKVLMAVYVKEESQEDGRGKQQGTSWETLEQMYRNNDAFYQSREFDDVEVVHLLYQEVDTGKVTHKIFPRLVMEGSDNFLFAAPDRYEAMSNVLWWLPYNYGDGFLKSCRGIASYLEQHCDLSNRFLGRAIDAAQTAATLLVQPKNAISRDKLQVVRAGILTMIDQNLDMQQANFQPKIGDILTIRRVSSDLMQNNTRESKDYAEDPAANQQPVSAAEIQEKSARASRGENAQTVFYAKQLQLLYTEIFRRLTRPDYVLSEAVLPGRKMAVVFARRCVERGVPLEILLDKENWRIIPVKPIGGGSPMARQQALNNMMQARGELDERGRRELMREYFAAQSSYEEVDRFVPVVNRDQMSSNEHSIAALESATFASGVQVPTGSDQVHTIHFTDHAKLVLEILKAVKESGLGSVDPQRAVLYLSAALPHMQEHLANLEREPTRKAFVQEGIQILRAGLQILDALKKQLQKLQQQQQEQQQAMQDQVEGSERRALTAEMQVEMYKADLKAQTDGMKIESLNRVRMAKAQEQLRIRAEQNATDLRLKSDKAAADIDLDRQKAQAAIEIKRSSKEAG